MLANCSAATVLGNMPVAQLWFRLLIASLVSPGAGLQTPWRGWLLGPNSGWCAWLCGHGRPAGVALISVSAGRRITGGTADPAASRLVVVVMGW